jgi:hypothetical protein
LECDDNNRREITIILTTKTVGDNVEEAANNKYKNEEKDCRESERMVQVFRNLTQQKTMYKKGQVWDIRDRRGMFRPDASRCIALVKVCF